MSCSNVIKKTITSAEKSYVTINKHPIVKRIGRIRSYREVLSERSSSVGVLGRDPLLGEVFIFMNRSCTSVKLLHWERGGLVLYHKRLEKGRFSLPVFDETSRYYHLSWRDLVLMVEGISPEKVRHKKRFENIAETAVKLQHFFVISDKFALSLQRF